LDRHSGGDHVIRINPGTLAWIQQLADEARDQVVEEIAADARRLAPVDTGELRRSIHVDGDEVVASADHAVYVELGTRYMAAQPFLGPALYKRRVIRGRGLR
jgi:HK97 gp10 family phage protein